MEDNFLCEISKTYLCENMSVFSETRMIASIKAEQDNLKFKNIMQLNFNLEETKYYYKKYLVKLLKI